MNRRTFLGTLETLTALSVTPDRLTNTTAPPLPLEEPDAWWWGYVQHAITLDPKHCTDKFLNVVVMRSNLNHTTDGEAKRVVRAAFHGAYERSDVPADYRR